jgi:hypothetical protein
MAFTRWAEAPEKSENSQRSMAPKPASGSSRKQDGGSQRFAASFRQAPRHALRVIGHTITDPRIAQERHPAGKVSSGDAFQFAPARS